MLLVAHQFGILLPVALSFLRRLRETSGDRRAKDRRTTAHREVVQSKILGFTASRHFANGFVPTFRKPMSILRALGCFCCVFCPEQRRKTSQAAVFFARVAVN